MPGARPAEEPFEQVMEVLGRDPGPAVPHAQREPASSSLRRDRIGVPAGEYWPAFSSTWASAADVSRGSTCTDPGVVHVAARAGGLAAMLHLLDGGVDDVGRMHPFPLGVDRAGLDARHVDDVLEQPVQARDLDAG